MSYSKKRNRKGQITLFIILGILFLFIFIFVFSFTKEVKTAKLSQEQEKVTGKLFEKEGLRLYVDSCLNSALEKGLTLVGKQGRIWKEQGGTGNFIDGQTGITFQNEKVSYALVNKQYPVFNQYPCPAVGSAAGYSPRFCEYHYPNSSISPSFPIKFGERALDKKTIEEDLQAFLINQTLKCVAEFIHNNISRSANFSTKTLNLTLEILPDLIKVRADYPLTLSLAGRQAFYLANFDFSYRSSFGNLLDIILTFPLSYDWSFVDFNYTKDTLEKDSFNHTCSDQRVCSVPLQQHKYKNLVSDFQRISLLNGDDLFQFSSPSGKILESQPFNFSFARQNRPPALDYLSRCAGEDYDYLVIWGDNLFGALNLTASALDPDEDTVKYSFSGENFSSFGFVNSVSSPAADNAPGTDPTLTSQILPPSNFYNLTIKATDDNLQDWQDLRVLVDKKSQPELKINNLYNQGPISLEDPICFMLSVPELFYSRALLSVNFSLNSNSQLFESLYPNTNYSLIINGNEIKDGCQLDSDFDINTIKGELTELGFGANNIISIKSNVSGYGGCGYEISNRTALSAAQCLPWRNNTHPYPSPYHKKTIYSTEEDINPFLANHTCCLGEFGSSPWVIAGPETPCYRAADLSCYNSSFSSYLTESLTRYCDGTRGNICNGSKFAPLKKINNLGDYKVFVSNYNDTLSILDNYNFLWEASFGTGANLTFASGNLCGLADKPECSRMINEECQGLPEGSFMFNQNYGYWCYNTDGDNCQFCDTEIVDTNNDGLFGNMSDSCGCGFLGSSYKCKRLKDGTEGTCNWLGSCS